MIIRRLTMNNFGVYAGTNTFEFSYQKPIVLIGGMNGRGKTTFLEAILLSLYGSNSIAYKESKFNSYNQYLRSYVNKDHWNQSSYVELEFMMNESTYDTYLIRREWDAFSKITREKITASQNGEESEFLTKNWAMFVENILPSALSSFYFFDGEKIAELAVDNTNAQMKESIRAMLGITVLDVLKSDLGRCIKKTGKKVGNNNSGKELEKLRQERDDAVASLEKIDQKVEKITEKITITQEKIEQLHKEYEAKGGAVVEQRQELLKQRAEIQSEISSNMESLIAASATELPLFLVRDLVSQIKLQAEDEHDDFIMKQALQQMDEYLNEYTALSSESIPENRRFLDFVKKQVSGENDQQIYGLSDHALFQLNGLAESQLENSVGQAKEKLKKKKILKMKLDQVESYLSLDINEKELGNIYASIKKHEDLLIPLQVDLSKLQQERSGINAVVISKTAEFNRNVEKYLEKVELQDDTDRMLKYSNMAIQIVDAFTVELQKRKTGNLGTTITQCYKKLANKKNLIEKIEMDPETLDMRYLDIAGKEVSKSSLSAGEKQLMVIAILWALALCSRKKLPVIIDTPLSRLDSQHRTAVITTYFPNASDQTIILSTDTEIDHNYYDMMSNSVGDEFTLEYCEETRSTSIKEGYFQNQ